MPSAPSARPPAPPSPRATPRWPRRPTSSSSRFPTAVSAGGRARDRGDQDAPRQDRDRHLHHRHQGGGGRRRRARARPTSSSSTRPCRAGRRAPTRPRLAIMVACPAGAYERFKPLLALMGKPFHVGPQARAGTGGEDPQQLPLGHRLGRHVGGHRLRHQAGHRDEDHPRHRQRLDGPQLRDRGQVPAPHHAWTLRRGLCGQASAQGYPPLPGERPGCGYQRTRWPLSWSMFGSRWRRAMPGSDITEMYPYHPEGPTAESDAPDDA